MSVSLWVGRSEFTVGSADFFHAFFSTIAVRLEGGAWGIRFPELMDELFQGQLSSGHVFDATTELATVRAELAAFAPDEIVWDADDVNARPPWDDAIAPGITSLANGFWTSDGQDLFEVIEAALRSAASTGQPVMIR